MQVSQSKSIALTIRKQLNPEAQAPKVIAVLKGEKSALGYISLQSNEYTGLDCPDINDSKTNLIMVNPYLGQYLDENATILFLPNEKSGPYK